MRNQTELHNPIGPFAAEADAAGVSHEGERYVPQIDSYNAAMHLGHMATYKHALRYVYSRHVLDIGCGCGYGAHYLASFGAHQVAAVDVDRVALDYARTVYAHARVHYGCNDGARLPFADAMFECVISSQVIEHLADPIHFLIEIKRVLKPGGFCLIATPNKDLFSPNRIGSSNVFHVSEMNLTQFEAMGRAVFPHVEMAGIPQNSLARQPDNTMLTKANELLRLEDYQIRRVDLTRCENLLLFGHTQANGELLATLPDSLSRASTRLAPCFWDAAARQWIELGLYPTGNLGDHPTVNSQQGARQVFRSPYDNLFRIDVALTHAGAGPVEIILRDRSPNKRVKIRAVVQSSHKKLSLTFEPIVDSAGREFLLELRLLRRLSNILLRRRKSLPLFEYRGGRLAFWTFHQTLPANAQFS